MPIYKNVKIIGYSDLIAVFPLNIYIWLIPLCLYNVFFFYARIPANTETKWEKDQ